MLHSHTRRFAVAMAALMPVVPRLSGADHGPVFGLATPTNPQEGWSFDLGVNGRAGTGRLRRRSQPSGLGLFEAPCHSQLPER
jgi:hypothetical protein